MLKKLLNSVREYRKASILAPFFMIAEVAMEVLIPFKMASLIDNGINKGDLAHVRQMSLLLILFLACAMLFGALSGRYAAIASTGLAGNLRHDMFAKVQQFSFSNIDNFSTASIVTRLTTDVTYVQNAYQTTLRIAVRSPAMLTMALLTAYSINPRFSLLFLCVLPVLGLGLALVIRHAHPVFERVFQSYDKLNMIVQENLRGIRVVKSFVSEEKEIEKFQGVSQGIFRDFMRAQKIVAFNAPLMQLCIYTSMLLVFWTSARLIVGGQMSTGNLMSVVTYVMQIMNSLMMLSMVFVMIIIARPPAERITELLEEIPEIQNPAQPVTKVTDGSIEFQDVAFCYVKGSGNCLNGINLSIASGETVGILGGTGSGKSSLMQLIPRLYDVSCGALLLGGVDVRSYDLKTLRDSVAVVLQKNVLFSGTIKENLRWGNEHATDEELIHACKLAQADEFIRSFPDGYDTHIEQGGTNVSGGQRQRLCIARALLKKPRVLILDDSTSAVDTKTDSLIRHAFKEELPDMTKLIVAQRVSSVEDADKIIVMEGGTIHAVGTHEELLASNPIYKEIYASQMQGGLGNE